MPKTKDMGAIEARWGHVIRCSTLPGKVSRKLAAGAEGVTGGTFEPGFYEEVRVAAAQWQARAGICIKVAILVPAGLWGLSAGFAFPDRDISLLGIGRHRFFLFHSAIPVWLLKKFYLAYLARQGDPQAFKNRALQKILGVIGAGIAFGVGCHLLVDVCQPKAVIFPWFGSLVTGSLLDDDLWLLANAVWCFKLSHDFLALALGGDLPRVKVYVWNTFAAPIKEGLLDAVSCGHR